MKDARMLLLEYALLEQGYYKLMRKIKNTDQLMQWARENGIPKKARIVDWIRKKRLEAIERASQENAVEWANKVMVMVCGCSIKGDKAYLCDIHKKEFKSPTLMCGCGISEPHMH